MRRHFVFSYFLSFSLVSYVENKMPQHPTTATTMRHCSIYICICIYRRYMPGGIGLKLVERGVSGIGWGCSAVTKQRELCRPSKAIFGIKGFLGFFRVAPVVVLGICQSCWFLNYSRVAIETAPCRSCTSTSTHILIHTQTDRQTDREPLAAPILPAKRV